MDKVKEFRRKLSALDPEADSFVIQVDELIEATDHDVFELLYPAIFSFFASHPESDMEAPGSLVHLVEDYYPNYVLELKDHLVHSPSYNAVLMTNRILNSDLPEVERTEYMRLLELVSASASAPSSVSELARDFIKHQEERSKCP